MKRGKKAELILWLVLGEICQDFIPSEPPLELRFPDSHKAQGDEMEALGLPSRDELHSSEGFFW